MANEQAKAFIDEATQSLQSGNFQQALDLAEQAIAIDPRNSDAHVLKGICESQMGQAEAANETFRKAIMHSPYNAKAYYNFAVHKKALGEKKEALELAREAASVDPRHTAARTLYSQLGEELSGHQVVPGGPAQGAPENPHDPLASPPPASAPTGPTADAPPTPSGGVLPPPATMAPQASRPIDNSLPPSQRPPGSPMAPPSGNPYEQRGNYARPGYEAYEHSLPWVGNMGGAWTTIGWCIAGYVLIIMILIGVKYASGLNAMVSGVQKDELTATMTQLGALFDLGVVGALMSFIWLIIDFLDRRAGVGWVLGTLVLTCCCTGMVSLPIYLAAGRKQID
jgi:hypothetical protein